jgi:hypothetical protein
MDKCGIMNFTGLCIKLNEYFKDKGVSWEGVYVGRGHENSYIVLVKDMDEVEYFCVLYVERKKKLTSYVEEAKVDCLIKFNGVIKSVEEKDGFLQFQIDLQKNTPNITPCSIYDVINVFGNSAYV